MYIIIITRGEGGNNTEIIQQVLVNMMRTFLNY